MVLSITRRCALLLAVFIAAFQPVSVSAAESTADVSVTQSVHRKGKLGEPGPELDGPPVIPTAVTFVYDVVNSGPDATEVTLRIRPDTFTYSPPGDSPYNHWTVPMLETGLWWQGNADDCNSDSLVCTFSLASGDSYRVMVDARANAPGPFSIYAKAASSVDDPVAANDKSTVYETRVRCSIIGTGGADRLTGTEARDSICGLGGRDRLVGVGDGDKLFGGTGADSFVSDTGDQVFVGGRGADRISYARSRRSVTVSLADNVATGNGHDTIVSVESVIGSRFGDYLTGRGRWDRLSGGRGPDRIAGRGGNDILAGGRGDDRFISRDSMFDAVRGGTGSDIVQADPGDSVSSARRVSYAPFYLDP